MSLPNTFYEVGGGEGVNYSYVVSRVIRNNIGLKKIVFTFFLIFTLFELPCRHPIIFFTIFHSENILSISNRINSLFYNNWNPRYLGSSTPKTTERHCPRSKFFRSGILTKSCPYRCPQQVRKI